MATTAPEYDAENIFAKIIDKKVPCFKVFESRTTLAFLDAYPMAEGHTIVVPKLKGHVDLLTMPRAKTSEFLSDVQKVAKAVKQAFDADAVNIWQNNGEAAGQTIFHPHFHVVPRKSGDALFKYPESNKEAITEEKAEPLKAKLEEALYPKKPLRKAKFKAVSTVGPDGIGMNLHIKICGDLTKVDTKAGGFYEVLCGDSSGTVIFSLREGQTDGMKDGAFFKVHNASTKMVNGRVRLAVDKWGKIELTDEAIEGEVNMDTKANVSETEYERVKGGK